MEPIGHELVVTVLTTGFWPVSSAPECVLPVLAVKSCKRFSDFYQEMHSGRKLTWHTDLVRSHPSLSLSLSLSFLPFLLS